MRQLGKLVKECKRALSLDRSDDECISERARRREMEESYNAIKRRDRAKLFRIAADEGLQLKALTLAVSSQRIERSACSKRVFHTRLSQT